VQCHYSDTSSNSSRVNSVIHSSIFTLEFEDIAFGTGTLRYMNVSNLWENVLHSRHRSVDFN